jgi:hypothetical protein
MDILNKYLESNLKDFISLTRREMDFVFNGTEKVTPKLMDQLTDREFQEEIKYFEKIGAGEILTICPIKMKQSKARFTTMFMNCLLHQRNFNLQYVYL